MNFDSNKFIRARIMQLIEQTNSKNLRFTTEFENVVERKRSIVGNSKDAFRIVVTDYGNKSDISFTDIEIEYAMDLYNGINPWTKSQGTNRERTI